MIKQYMDYIVINRLILLLQHGQFLNILHQNLVTENDKFDYNCICFRNAVLQGICLIGVSVSYSLLRKTFSRKFSEKPVKTPE